MKEKIVEDAILAGVLGVLGCEITPTKNQDGRVIFIVGGDYDRATGRLYRNDSVPALDMLKSIKLCRSAIFSLRGQR